MSLMNVLGHVNTLALDLVDTTAMEAVASSHWPLADAQSQQELVPLAI